MTPIAPLLCHVALMALLAGGATLLTTSLGVAASDTTGPSISDLVVEPVSASAGQTISVAFDIADPSGVQNYAGSALWRRTGGTQTLKVDCFTTGQPQSYRCSGSLVITATTVVGTYSPVWLSAWDSLANMTNSVGQLPALVVFSAPPETPTLTSTPTATPPATESATSSPTSTQSPPSTPIPLPTPATAGRAVVPHMARS